MLHSVMSLLRSFFCCSVVLALQCDVTVAQTATKREITADVVIAGGSTAALAAAIASADSGADTVLIEPTDWIGGQLTSSGVPPVDEAWHKIVEKQTGEVVLDVAKIARDPRNMSPILRDALKQIGNPGRGWVSRFCYQPKSLLENHLEPEVKRHSSRLVILRETVVKELEIDGQRLLALTAIRRTANHPERSYSALPSTEIPDWYSRVPSERFNKEIIRISGGKSVVFIDATEWGELLALSGSSYLQGVELREGELDGNDRCGQSVVFGFAQRLHAAASSDRAPEVQAVGLGLGKFAERVDAWRKIWTYRRLLGNGSGPTAGDITLQNWGYEPRVKNGGNDYPFGYIFLTRKDTAETVNDWQGGVDLRVMAAAENRAYAWHHWLKRNAPEEFAPEQISLEYGVLGTSHGLSKLPYIRDTRRSIGLDGFILTINDLTGDARSKTGKTFHDRIAIGSYPADVHFLDNQIYPSHIKEHRETRPFYIPFRALTHRDFDNLLVAGKTMAQSFMANSATRVHPVEWSSGTAAGVIAAFMASKNATTSEVLRSIEQVQKLIKAKTPIDWSF